jgi:DNA mismatch repair protein MutS2
MTDERTLRLLEFARIREDVAGYCLSEEGRSALVEALPLLDRAEIETLKAKVGLLVGLFQEGREPPPLSFPDISSAAKTAAKSGSSLDQEELFAIGLWSESYASFLAFMKEAEKDGPMLGIGAAPDLGPVARIVFRVLNKDGSLRDLPELREARSRISKLNRAIAAITDSYYKDEGLKSMLQSDEPTLRDGRTVLPVRANFRARVKGIVHEVSATGQTVFIEPEELVLKNNELIQEEARYRQELLRVLRDATVKLFDQTAAIAEARSLVSELDGIYARARHARVGGLTLARDLASGFTLRKARHPLLGSKAVPIDVELPEGTRTLIVTGPNTGGKTVTLKTIGLLALMNQFGLALPAAPETGFACFDSIFADIGDEQSIDQSLSTFSGHIRVIGRIVASASSRSLVLLDELGSGTDPEEGCAVAMSLLDWFIGAGCLTVLTTHHGILKNYGYSRPACLNASMDFDASSLSPTYRILMGVPGESRALEVASKNGLPPMIVGGARKYLAEERADVSELIKGLTQKHRELEDIEADRRKRLREAMEAQRKADLSGLRARQRELELRERGVSDLRRLLSESRKTLENLVRGIREGELTTEKTRGVKDFLADLAREVGEEEERLERFKLEPSEEGSRSMEGALDAEDYAGSTEAREGGEEGRNRSAGSQSRHVPAAEKLVVAEGAQVLVGAGRKRGRVLRRAKKGYWVVETESVRLTLSEAELQPVKEEAPAKLSVQVELAPRGEGGSARAVFELDLRGFRLAEALDAVEKQVDAAGLQNLSLFQILHGTGEGVLGRGIHDYLRNHPGVAEYHFARPEEGGYGKTIVRMK